MKRGKVDISQVCPNEGHIEGLPANPRLIKDERFRKLVKSIRDLPEMTEARDLLVYPHGGKYIVIGGNMRLRAYRELGWKEVPCCILPEDIPVEKLRKMVIQDNNPFGETDWNMIANEWDVEELKDWGVDLPESWDTSETEEQKEAEEDDFSDEDAEKAEPRVKLGEIWQLGEHRLMCGDSTDAASVALLMDCEKADMVFTDPPFGNNVGYGRGQLGVRRILNDENTDVLESMFDPIDGVLKNNSHCLVWIQWRTYPKLVSVFGKYHLRTVIIWDKKQAGLSGGGFAEQYEMLCVFIKGKATQKEYCGNVWQCSRVHDNREKSEHPHKKPIEILAKALHLCSNKDDLILDIFGGSGSTLIACEQLKRKCYMMELDPHYCDVIIARWEKMTGREAVKVYG